MIDECWFCGGAVDDGHMEEWLEYTSKLLDYVDELKAELANYKNGTVRCSVCGKTGHDNIP